jgi:hypothetical protein
MADPGERHLLKEWLPIGPFEQKSPEFYRASKIRGFVHR